MLERLTPPTLPSQRDLPPPPSDEECFRLWDVYGMLPHIRSHSLAVASVATTLALEAVRAGLDVHVQTVRASALLHDIAKTYTINHGGNHSQLGGAWMQDRLRNPVLSMGIIHHVHWPWKVDVRAYFLPLAIIYGDKRVRHDTVVSLAERFDDLYERYGTTQYIRDRLAESRAQADALELALGQTLGADLNERSADSWRMV